MVKIAKILKLGALTHEKEDGKAIPCGIY